MIILKPISKENFLTYAYLLLLFLLLFLFSNLSVSLQAGESWIYWFLNRDLENGLPILGRSPLYVVYIKLFDFIENVNANAVKIEWLLTSFLCISSIYYFINSKITKIHSFLICIALIPYIWTNEPRSQVLGAAFTFLALAVYVRKDNISLNYLLFVLTLLLAATFTRPNYFLFFLIIIFYELLKTIKDKKKNNSLELRFFFLICFAISSTLLFITWNDLPFISTHKWNNGWGSSIQWFPGANSGLFNISFIGHYNWYYVEKFLPNSITSDFYFTHKIAYNNAQNILEMISNNPDLFFETLFRNLKIGIYNLNVLGRDLLSNKYLQIFSSFLIFLSICNLILKFDRLAVLTGAALLIVLISFASYPKDRYLLPIIPFIILGVMNITIIIFQKKSNFNYTFSTIILLLFFLNTGVLTWVSEIKSSLNQKNNQISVTKKVDLISSYNDIKVNLKNCGSIIAYEHRFFEAFMSNQIKGNVLDVWDIPPFGYNDYLIPYQKNKAIDCLAISYSLEERIGLATNIKIRYLNHIIPYKNWMIDNGAKTIYIKNFGKIIKFQNE